MNTCDVREPTVKEPAKLSSLLPSKRNWLVFPVKSAHGAMLGSYRVKSAVTSWSKKAAKSMAEVVIGWPLMRSS